MAPRLKGHALRLALRAAGTSLGIAAIRRMTFAEYEMQRLLDLTDDQLAPLDHEPRPVMGSQPRQWDDQRLGVPAAVSGRTSARMLTTAFAAGTSSPSAVLDALYRRNAAAEFGPAAFSPFATLNEARARRHAAEADARYAAGTPMGPLDGVPVPIKDEIDLEGLPTHGGTAFLTEPAESDGWAAQMLFAGGAVIPGKTHTTEWGMSPLGINPNFDMPRNAHRPGRCAGGSSTGTGAAVTLGLAPVGLGSDGGGSIRIPACMQGVFGIKPTFQRIGRTGDVFGRGTVGTLGPIGQSTADLVDFLTVSCAQVDPQDYGSQYAPQGSAPFGSWELALGRGVKGARIGVPHREWKDADPRIAALCLDALRALEADGAKLVDIELPHAAIAQAIGVLTIGPETEAHVCDYAAEFGHLFGGELRLQMAILGSVRAHEYLIAGRARAALRRSTADVIGGIDLIALPTLPVAPPVYPLSENRRHVADDEGTRRVCRYTFLANLSGQPAGTVPVGMLDGLPVGLQFVGDAWDEASVLAAMAHVERLEIAAIPAPPGHKSLLS